MDKRDEYKLKKKMIVGAFLDCGYNLNQISKLNFYYFNTDEWFDIVNTSFVWSHTKEGSTYWQNLNEKLIMRVVKYYLRANKYDRISLISKHRLLDAIQNRCYFDENIYTKVKYN